MKYILEIYYQGECIEQRERQEPFLVPENGDRIYINFQNPVYSEENGFWWVVKEKKHLLFSATQKLQTLMLYCEPDPKEGE